MNAPLKSSKGVSTSVLRLLEKAMACGFQPGKFSCGPRRWLNRLKDEKARK